MARHNPATVALRMLLDALNDENDEEYQEAADKLSDEIERGHWPQARLAATQFLGANDEDAVPTPVVADDTDELDDGPDNWGDDP